MSVDATEARIKPKSALDCEDDKEAIEKLLALAGVSCNEAFLPTKETRTLFNPEFGPNEAIDVRRFTISEDRLLMAGIEKFGEKRFDLIATEYLPTRKMEMLNRRYCKLTVMACNDRIAARGNLRRMRKNPPRPESDMPDEVYWTLDDDVELHYGVHLKGREVRQGNGGEQQEWSDEDVGRSDEDVGRELTNEERNVKIAKAPYNSELSDDRDYERTL